MDSYLGKSYQIEGCREWTEAELEYWKKRNCGEGKHLWDEVLSTDNHYLFCDACEKTTKNLNTEVEQWDAEILFRFLPQ